MAMAAETISLVKYDAMCLAIEAARAVDEVKDIRDKALAIQMYAHQAKNRASERHAAEIRVRAERRFGQLYRAGRKAKGKRLAGRKPDGDYRLSDETTAEDCTEQEAIPTLEELGVSRDQSSEWQKLAEMPDAEFEEAVAEQEIPTAPGVLNHRAQGTGQNEWYTPPEYIAAVRDVLGNIDLDPASTENANQAVNAARFYTAEDDGLRQRWNGRVFLNPPYTQPLIAQFAEKLTAEVVAGYVTEAILLTHNYTDTAWFHTAQEYCDAICFTRGRIGFLSPSGEKAAPTQGQAFFYYGLNLPQFVERFRHIGFVMVPYGF